jgi:hypothetical protein
MYERQPQSGFRFAQDFSRGISEIISFNEQYSIRSDETEERCKAAVLKEAGIFIGHTEMEDHARPYHQFFPVIHDGQKFSDVISRLPTTEPFINAVDFVLQESLTQLGDVAYNEEEEWDDSQTQIVKDRLSILEEIMPALQSRGFEQLESVERINRYLAYDDQGALYHVLEAESKGFFAKTDGPESWCHTENAQDLKKKWFAALVYLFDLKHGENPSVIAPELSAKLAADFKSSSEWLANEASDSGFGEEAVWKLSQAMMDIQVAWEMLESVNQTDRGL